MDTRIKKLNEGLYDAIVLSYAGIKSLALEANIAEVFSTKEIIPSAGQGVITLQCRENDDQINSILEKVNHQETHQRVSAERNVLKILEGDCETAVGAHAYIDDDKIILEAELFSLDGSQRFYEKEKSKVEDAEILGKEIGQKLKLKSKGTYKK